MRFHRSAILAGAIGLVLAGGLVAPDASARQNGKHQQDNEKAKKQPAQAQHRNDDARRQAQQRQQAQQHQQAQQRQAQQREQSERRMERQREPAEHRQAQ